MTAFLISTGLVAVSEIGDKTQLLALVLATRFRQPGAIILGIFLATVANHALAGWAGAAVAAWIGPEGLRYALALGFLAMAGWVLIPDEVDDEGVRDQRGALLTTIVTFFVAEMGDKTQVATVALAAAHPGQTVAVVMGTTVGMLLANVPVVLMAEAITARFDLTRARYVAAVLFVMLAVWVAWG